MSVKGEIKQIGTGQLVHIIRFTCLVWLLYQNHLELNIGFHCR